MKRRKTPRFTKQLLKKTLVISSALFMMLTVPIATMQAVQADEYDAKIQALEREIDQYESQASKLRKKIGTLQDEIAGIEREKKVIQTQIDLNQAKYDKLQREIKRTEREIAYNRSALGVTIADMYVDDTISPIEMLASSNNIGDYVDKQTYRTSISDQLQSTIDTIAKLKAELDKQRIDVKRALTNQRNSREALANKEAQRASILRQTKGRESAYKKIAEDRQQEKLRIQQEQQAAIEAAMAASGGGSGVVLPGTSGGYPWNDSNCHVDGNAWSYGGIDGNGTDGMGYGCRQCVSYVAWKMYKETGYAAVNWGNANQWPGNARAAGMSTGSTPQKGALGVISSGQYGHIVYVEDVVGGEVIISQYNYFNAGGPGWGHYSRMRVPAGTYDTYIYP